MIEVDVKQGIEKEIPEQPVVEPKVFKHPTIEEKKENIQKMFKKGLKRELIEKELIDYLFLYEKGETNYWLYMEKLKSQRLDLKTEDAL